MYIDPNYLFDATVDHPGQWGLRRVIMA